MFSAFRKFKAIWPLVALLTYRDTHCALEDNLITTSYAIVLLCKSVLLPFTAYRSLL